MQIDAATVLPLGLVLSALGLAVTVGLLYGRLTGRIDSLEKADASLNASVQSLIKTIEEIKQAAMPTHERLIAIEIEQKQQRRLLEDIQGFLKEHAKLE